MKRRILGLSLVFLLATATGSLADPDHVRGYGSVSDRRIAYTSGETFQYSGARAHAVSVWNDLNIDSNVTIALRVGTETIDAKWVHWDDCSTTRYGQYHWESSAKDLLQMNACYLGTDGPDGSGADYRVEKAIAAHEMGHALNYEDNEFDDTVLMDYCAGCDSPSNPLITKPQSHEEYHYYKLWP